MELFSFDNQITTDKIKEKLASIIKPVDVKMFGAIKSNWDKVAKPLDSMGEFEGIICKIGAINQNIVPKLDKKGLVVYASDNGIVEENISQSGQEVTSFCVRNMNRCKTSVCVMAAHEKIEMKVIDLGVNSNLDDIYAECVINRKISKSTKNFAKEPAMSIAECIRAINTGIEIAWLAKANGIELLGVGEIGIGNTTTTAAVCSALLELPGEQTAGRGAGLGNAGLIRKINVINSSIIKYAIPKADVLSILATFGGYDIAAFAGTMIGAAIYQLPVVLDGVISLAGALIACSLCANVADYLIASHISREPAAKKIIESLGLRPVIDANMALGEGTGAVMAIGMICLANEVYVNCSDFADLGIEQYSRQI